MQEGITDYKTNGSIFIFSTVASHLEKPACELTGLHDSKLTTGVRLNVLAVMQNLYEEKQ